jgi:hypothetical protein
VRAAALFIAWVALGGCVSQRQAAWLAPPQPLGEVSDDTVDGLVRLGDAAWLKRQEPAQLDEAIRAFRAALRYRPADDNVLVRLSRVSLRRGRMLRGRAAADVYDEAAAFAERALAARNPNLAEAARAGQTPEAVFARAEPADVPALAAYIEALMAWAMACGIPTLLAERQRITAAALRTIAFDRAAGWAAADRALAVLDCELPEARQNLRDALEHFEAAIAAAPAYLPTRLAYAEEYAPRVRDVALYRRLLDEVVAGDAGALPEALAENLEAQAAARRLIRKRP